MSYLRLLDEARVQLERGDLLAAEEHLRRAREAWSRSRVRAPLVERGLEPVLRRAGRLFGRKSDAPVLPVFGHRVRILEEDLVALARLLRDEALDLAQREVEGHGRREADLLERALRLDRESEGFSLDSTERWAVARAYLQVGRRLARPVRPELLPPPPAPTDQNDWLREWAHSWLSGGATGDSGTLDWVIRQAMGAARTLSEDRRAAADWWWIAARAALRDSGRGRDALDATHRALESGLSGADREQALRALAGLIVNERTLAVPGADTAAVLGRFAPLATGHTWPPPEIAELVRRRRVHSGTAAVVGVAWSEDARELVLVSHAGGRALDALVLRPTPEPDPADPLAAAPPEARGWIHRWLPERCVLLLTDRLPAALAPLLGDAPRIEVRDLERVVEGLGGSVEMPAPALSHPLWSAAGADPSWCALAERARGAVPVLLRLVTDSPALSSDWGREGLRALAEHGLSLCGAIDRAVEALLEDPVASDRSGDAGPGPEDLQAVEVGLELRWPRLEARPWPRADTLSAVNETPTRSDEADDELAALDGDVWIGRVGGADELARRAVEDRRAEVLTAGRSRAEAIARHAAALTDPRRVAVAPRRERCAEPWLRLLQTWIREAVSDSSRQTDVLWLWRALAETPVGEPLDLLDVGLGESGRSDCEEVARNDHACDPGCRVAGAGGCWSAQLAGRREAAGVWVVDLERGRDPLDAPNSALLDDPRSWVVGARSAVAEDRLRHALERAESAERAWLWLPGGPLTDPLLAAWRRRMRRTRPLHRRPVPPTAPPRLFLAPPGYRPGDPLLIEEARAVLRARIAVFGSSTSSVGWWRAAETVVGTEVPEALEGVAAVPDVSDLVVVELTGEEPPSELLLLATAAGALSHASDRVVVLDPRLAAVLGHDGGPWGDGEDVAESGDAFDRMSAAALDTGARLLESKGGASPPTWAHPLDAHRLGVVGARVELDVEVGPERRTALARALREFGRGQALLVGAARDDERRLVVDTLRALAESTGDGGPLGIRCVVVVGAPSHWTADDSRARRIGVEERAALGTVVLEVERGGVSRLDLDPRLLDDEAVLSWARRFPAVAWVLVRGERDLDSDPLPAAEARPSAARARALADAVERAGAGLLVWTDAAGPTAERLFRAIDGRLARVGPVRSAASRTLRVRESGALTVACPHCEATMEVEHAHTRCPACRRRAWTHVRGRARILAALEEAMARRLSDRDDERSWWAVGLDPGFASRMRDRLGLEPWSEEDTPLLSAAVSDHDELTPSVLLPSELWERRARVPSVILLGAPRDALQLRALVQRLDALGAADSTLEILVGPVGVTTSGVRHRARSWRWTAARTEVEFRLRARLRRHESEQVRLLPGLGPLSEAPRLESESTEVLDALSGIHRSAAAVEAAAAAAIDDLERHGLRFGAEMPAPLDVQVLDSWSGFVDWAWSEGLLEADDGGSALPSLGREVRTGDRVASRAWERALRRAPGVVEIALDELIEGVADSPAVESVPEGLLPSERWVGIAGAGRTHWLRERVDRARELGHRVLVVTAHPLARVAWTSAEGRPSGCVEVVTAEEVALAFLRRTLADGREVAPRLLPAPGRQDGEGVRLRLMRETSRRYAAVAGSVPAVDAGQLRRVVEGLGTEGGAGAPGPGDPALDSELLARCAREARAAEGWLTTSELREQCRRWTAAESSPHTGWSRRYRCVAVDDAHAIHSDLLDFLRELFAGSTWWETVDPLLGGPGRLEGLDPSGPRPEIELRSHRLGRNALDAIEVLWRDAPALPGRPRTHRRGRDESRLESVRLLTLQAAHDWILEGIDPDRSPDRTAILAAHEQDRAWLAQALRGAGHRVRVAERVGRWAVTGPRELLAALHLLLDEELERDRRERLLGQVLGPGFMGTPAEIGALLHRFEGTGSADRIDEHCADVAQARVDAFGRLREEISADSSLESAVGALLGAGTLDGLLGSDAAVGRLRDLLEAEGKVPIVELGDRAGGELLADPLAPTDALWLLGPDDLAGMEFDHVVHVCTGFEPPTRHYQALSRARMRFSILYSERDPLR